MKPGNKLWKIKLLHFATGENFLLESLWIILKATT
jgi:hypothetical protein